MLIVLENFMIKRQRLESGQALIFLAFSVVALIGFAALAIDGGMIYADRRHAQNAADSAALAAALAKVNSEDWNIAGLNRAASNGYDNNGVTNSVDVNNPPVSGQYAGNSEYIQVFINAVVETSLVHFVYSGPVENTVEAIARVEPGVVGPMYNGDAIVGLKPNGCSVVWKHGNSATQVTGGGVWVNSDDTNCAFEYKGGAGDLILEDDQCINVVGGSSYSGGTPSGNVCENQPQFPYPPLFDVPVPTCGGSASWDGGTNTLSPGNWTGDFPPAGVTNLEEGIYCITDTDFRMNAHDELYGDNILIYMSVGGDIRWNGNAHLEISGRNSGDYEGLLIYISHQDYTSPGNCDATLNGTQSSVFTGTIYAPTCNINLLGGGESTGWKSQLIGYTVEMGGNSNLDMFYDVNNNHEITHPPELELTK